MLRYLLMALCWPLAAVAVDGPTEIKPGAARAPVLGLSLVGERIVAVGERGHILLSDDDGRSWQQVSVPTRTTLTAVDFVDAKNGWAVGHFGTALRSRDGGLSWDAVALPVREDDALLDVHFSSSERGFIVGAYGLYLHTQDGGDTWEQEFIVEEELHFNRIRSSREGLVLIVGEAGILLMSENDGDSWDELEGPYEGSYFGLTLLEEGSRVVHGLRGNLFRQDVVDEEWVSVEMDTDSILMASTELTDGRLMVTGSGSRYFISADGGRSFMPFFQGIVEGSASLIESPGGALIAAGLNGVHRLAPPDRASLEAR